MAQAETIPTTRRSFLAGVVATIPATAFPATAAPVDPDAALLALGAHFHSVADRLDAVLNELGPAELAFAEWERGNPKPEWDNRSYDAWMQAVRVDGQMRLDWQQHEHEFHLALKQKRRVWRQRYEAARQQTGLAAAEEAETAVNKELSAAADAITDTPATSVAGMRCKARAAARHYTDSNVAWSIVEDLLEMGT